MIKYPTTIEFAEIIEAIISKNYREEAEWANSSTIILDVRGDHNSDERIFIVASTIDDDDGKQYHVKVTRLN